MTATAAVFAALGARRRVGRSTRGPCPSAAWPDLSAIGFVASFLAIQTFYAGARRIGAAQAALVSTVEPVFIVVLAAFVPRPAPGADPARRGRAHPVGVSSPRPRRGRAARRSRRRRSRRRSRADRGGVRATCGRARASGPGPPPASPAAPALTNAPSEPRPMNRNPSSRWRARTAGVAEQDAGRLAVPLAGRDDRVEARRGRPGRRSCPGRRGCATGRPGRRTGRRRRRSAAISSACSTALGDSIWMMPTIRALIDAGRRRGPSSPRPAPRVDSATPRVPSGG